MDFSLVGSPYWAIGSPDYELFTREDSPLEPSLRQTGAMFRESTETSKTVPIERWPQLLEQRDLNRVSREPGIATTMASVNLLSISVSFSPKTLPTTVCAERYGTDNLRVLSDCPDFVRSPCLEGALLNNR